MSKNKSKRLAYLLRHDHNYDFEDGGWRGLSDLYHNHSFSLEDVIEIVSNDNKGRFEFNSNKTKVRALYGHSVKIDLSLTIEKPPEYLYHGTALKYISSIEQCGLLPKSRQYVHLTENLDIAIEAGLRHGEPVLLIISSHKMFSDGYVFHPLPNGLWLTKEVPKKYIKSAFPKIGFEYIPFLK